MSPSGVTEICTFTPPDMVSSHKLCEQRPSSEEVSFTIPRAIRDFSVRVPPLSLPISKPAELSVPGTVRSLGINGE